MRRYTLRRCPLLTRRVLVSGLFSAVGYACTGRMQTPGPFVAERLTGIHSRVGGRLGIHALDTQTGRRIAYDDMSRYAMASTFKLALAGAVLAQIDRGALRIDQNVAFGENNIVSYSPVTSSYLPRGSMTVAQLCAAIVEVSDNTAANLLLTLVGGPSGLTQFMRTLGDRVTRLDRIETELNTNFPGDARDTTSPRAMVGSMEQLLTGPALTDVSRAKLIEWLVNSRTGLQRIRAGLPSDWRAGDKTGTGANGAANDIAVAWPPRRLPILIAIYMSESPLGTDELSAAHVEIAAAIAGDFTR